MESKKNKWILALFFIGVLMGALDISIAGPSIPAIETTIKTDRQQLQWIFSMYILANLSGIFFMTRLSDLFGRRKIYFLSLLVFGTGSLIVALSNNMSTLLADRAVQGFGASGTFPVASATVGDIFPPEKS
jgi:MFS family permease